MHQKYYALQTELNNVKHWHTINSVDLFENKKKHNSIFVYWDIFAIENRCNKWYPLIIIYFRGLSVSLSISSFSTIQMNQLIVDTVE